MSFIDIWNTYEGRYMFWYCVVCAAPLFGLAILIGLRLGEQKRHLKAKKRTDSPTRLQLARPGSGTQLDAAQDLVKSSRKRRGLQ